VAWLRRRRLGRELERFPAPPPPWTDDYWPQHAELISFLLDSPDALALFAGGKRLPDGYGPGFDERVVEYPWLLSRLAGGRVLDAGATLNHAHVLERVLARGEELHLVTLAPEQVELPGATYDYADLRELPYENGSFDAVVSLSTLEHVGMDTSRYGADAPRGDPAAELERAESELVRVLAPGGTLLVTVPYGAREDHGWFRQLDRDEVEGLFSFANPSRDVDVYRYTAAGWQVSSLDQAAHERYHDHHADPTVPPDHAAAARAVACVQLSF